MELLGRTIGRIRVLETLGEGGMGTVYLGYDEGLHRKVALKALRAGRSLDADTRARFLREARILSHLEHPSICRIHDLIDEDGSEVLVLEYVEGRTLGEAMADGLPAKVRLRIAIELAEALVAAHAAGVVHRDLKPDNVLVADDGSIKVLDFGLARSMPAGPLPPPSSADPGEREGPEGGAPAGEDDLADTLHASEAADPDDPEQVRTRIGSVIGTVAYMSPEQAAGEPVTLATDMYSLGVMLHELFTGRPAYAEGLALGERLQAVAEARTRPVEGIDPELAKLVERLEARRPDDRPRAADVLARLRWLEDRPRRRRRRILVAALVLVAALAGLRHHLRLRAEQARTMAALEEAERRGREARQVSEFLVQVFETADPGATPGREPSAREVLLAGSARVEAELADQPLIRARLAETLGTVLQHLGDYEEAARKLEGSLELYREELPGDHPEVAEAHLLLGQIHHFRDRYAEAREHLEAALDMARRLPETPERLLLEASTLEDLGRIAHDGGDVDEAARLLEEALATRLRAATPPDRFLSQILAALGAVASDRARYDEAERLYRRSAAILSAEVGAEHPAVATVLTELGSVLLDAGHLAEGEVVLRDALRVREAALDPTHPNLAISVSYLALAARVQGRLGEAEELYRRAIGMFEAGAGEAHYNVGAALALLADLQVRAGRWVEAEESLDRSAAIWRETGLEQGYNALLVESVRADLEVGRGRPAAAEAILRRLIPAWEETMGADVPETIQARVALTEVLAGREPAEAEALADRAVAAARNLFAGQDVPDVRALLAEALVARAEVHEAAGRPEAAAHDRREVVEQVLPEPPADFDARAVFARALLGLGEAEKAEPILQALRASGWVDPRLPAG